MPMIAAIQMTSGSHKKKNIAKARALLRKGVDMGAGLLALPENFSFMGEEGEKIKVAEDMHHGESVDFLREFAAENGVWILGGSIPVLAGKSKVFNTSLLVNDEGKVTARYDKIHLFDVKLGPGKMYRESDFVRPGRRRVEVDTPFGRVGLSICYDLRFPELYRNLTTQGARILCVPSAFTLETGKDHWEALIRARAIENQVYMVAPAQFGNHPGKRTTYGNAMIADPWGKVVARASEKEQVIVAEIDPSYQEEIRQRIPCLDYL